MIILFTVILIIHITLFIFTKKYKRLVINNLDRKKHPLKFLYGLSMFLEDKLLYKLKILYNDKEVETLKALYIKDDIKDIQYMLKIKKLSVSICVFIGFITLGFTKCIELEIASNQFLYKLERTENGEGTKRYRLEAKLEGRSNSLPVEIEVEELKYSEKEIVKKIEDAYKNVMKTALGDNDSWDNISSSLNLVDKVQEIKVMWQINNSKLIDFNGNIYSEDVEGEGVLTYITAILTYEEVEKEYEIPLIIKPQKNKELTIDEKIESKIVENNSEYEMDVVLPTKIDEKEIKFINVIENQSGIFLGLGVFGSVIILISLNRELSSNLKKRNIQMMIDYPEIVSKLTLLSEAGISISRAWNRIVEDYEKSKINNKIRFAYEEMRLTNIKMKNGTPEAIAYAEFGRRCNLQSYLRLGSLLEQNLTKGTKGMKVLLEQEVTDAFQYRKNVAKTRGEEASTKLLLPMVLMLVVVIVIIVVPAFLSMNL